MHECRVYRLIYFSAVYTSAVTTALQYRMFLMPHRSFSFAPSRSNHCSNFCYHRPVWSVFLFKCIYVARLLSRLLVLLSVRSYTHMCTCVCMNYIHVIWYINSLFFLCYWIIFYCMKISWFIYPFTCWKTFGLFPVWRWSVNLLWTLLYECLGSHKPSFPRLYAHE